MTQKMIYEDYLKAALKQLKTCRRLENSYCTITSNYEKNDILRSIFYLSGYIIEGTINYTLFKIFNYPLNKDVTQLNEFVSIDKKLAFYKSNLNYFSGKKYFLQSHNFMQNIEILKIKLPTKFNTIPVFSDSSQNPKLYSLLRKWNVKVRYQTKSTNLQTFNFENYSESDILAFLDLAETIYKKLPLIV